MTVAQVIIYLQKDLTTENNKNLKIGIGMRFRSSRSSVYKLRQKYWNLETIVELDDRSYRKVNIPPIIWNDGHAEWSRWYWFKDKGDHMGRGQYIFK